MNVLRKYIDKKSLEELKNSFSESLQTRVGFCDLDQTEIIHGDYAYVDLDAITFPILLDDTEIGFLYIERSNDVSDDMIDRMGNLFAVVINKIGCEGREVHSRVEQLIAIHKVTSEINQGVELQKILKIVTKTVVETMSQKSASIRRLSPNGKELTVHSAHTAEPQYLDLRPIQLSESILDREVLGSDRPVYVEDMTTDPRVLDHEQSKKEGVVSALCTPMIYNGKTEGILRVFSGEKHSFDWFEIQLAKTLANAVASAVAHERSILEAEGSWEIQRQVKLAGEVQRRMIPLKPPTIKGLDIADCYIPCQQLSGDFFDYFQVTDNKLGIVICDVVGKGIRASLLMASIRASLQAHIIQNQSVSNVLEMVNYDLVRSTLSNDFATLFYCEIDLEQKCLEYCCAGHLPPLLIRNGEVQYLKAGGGMVGVMDDMDFPVDKIDLQKDDRLIMYTDGLVEALNFDEEQYGRERVESAVMHAIENGFNIQSTLKHCCWDMRKFAGLHARSDDLTMVGLQVL